MISRKENISWLQALSVYRQPKVIAMLFLGFSAGLPLLLVFGTLSFWLRKEGVDRTTIGYISWVAILYGIKFLWAPQLIVCRFQSLQTGWANVEVGCYWLRQVLFPVC